MQVTYNLTRDDFWHFTRYVYTTQPQYRRSIYSLALLVPLLSFGVSWLVRPNPSMNAAIAVVFTAAALPALYWLTKREVMKMPSSKPGLLGEHTITIGPDGVHERTTVNEGLHVWAGVHAVLDDSTHIYLFVDTYMAHVIPKRDFATSGAADQFLALARRYMSEAAKK